MSNFLSKLALNEDVFFVAAQDDSPLNRLKALEEAALSRAQTNYTTSRLEAKLQEDIEDEKWTAFRKVVRSIVKEQRGDIPDVRSIKQELSSGEFAKVIEFAKRVERPSSEDAKRGYQIILDELGSLRESKLEEAGTMMTVLWAIRICIVGAYTGARNGFTFFMADYPLIAAYFPFWLCALFLCIIAIAAAVVGYDLITGTAKDIYSWVKRKWYYEESSINDLKKEISDEDHQIIVYVELHKKDLILILPLDAVTTNPVNPEDVQYLAQNTPFHFIKIIRPRDLQPDDSNLIFLVIEPVSGPLEGKERTLAHSYISKFQEIGGKSIKDIMYASKI